MQRSYDRKADEARPVKITRNFTEHAEGSVLIEVGKTKVICTASVEERVPPFMRGQNKGWVTAEYSMLPRATTTRNAREAARGKQGGRTLEIQRLIGRSLRAAVNLTTLGDRTITIDCDVIQADGGTRTASITGGYVALADACQYLIDNKLLERNPIDSQIAAISVGMLSGQAILDLDYSEDSTADTDMNVVMTDDDNFIEVQGTAEEAPFELEEIMTMLKYAQRGIRQLMQAQNEALKS